MLPSTLHRALSMVLLSSALAACQAVVGAPSSGAAGDDKNAPGDTAAATPSGSSGNGGGDGNTGNGAATPTSGGDSTMNGGPSASSDAPPPACTTDLTPFVTSLKVPGISGAIVKNGHVVCTAVAGKAVLPGNGRTEKAVTTDTDFLWASVSKTVTATAVMQLWERGKFQLDDSIDKYLGFSVRVPTCKATPITFRQLLTHTSSITDNDTVINSKPVAVSSGDPTVALDRLVKGYFTPGGEFYHTANFDSGCPGTQSDYSNMGVALLGYLVQVISGEDLYAYYQAHIFGPLGMKNTSFHLADLDAATLAAPLGTEAQYGEADFPDGMMRTSPVQLGKFLAMISQGGTYDGKQLLMPSTVKEMLKQQTALAPASTNGITQGLILYTVNKFGPVTWGHDGDDDGATSNMFFDPATKTGVILVSNGVWSGDPGAVPAMSALFGESAKY